VNNTEAKESLELLRYNLIHSATPNMKRAIENKAPIAALVYGLALIDTMAGFFYGVGAKKQAQRGDGVGIRYEKFIKEYLSPAHSGCDYSNLDVYKSLRCNMAHSLTPGHRQKGKFDFYLVEDTADKHGSKKTNRTIIFDVPTFCNDVLHAVDNFLNDVEQSIAQNLSSPLLENFKGWWDEGYSILVSD
jgi:hypothetical protein